MDWRSLLEARPIVVALAGSNGAGKSTFFHAHLADTGLRFVNADDLAVEMGTGAYEAAELAASLRAGLVGLRESFVFETVLSDPHGSRVSELVETGRNGIHVVMVFIRIDSPATSKQRVAMRVMQGGTMCRMRSSKPDSRELSPTSSGRSKSCQWWSFSTTPTSPAPSSSKPSSTPADGSDRRTVRFWNALLNGCG
jgi:hypothetical protein